MYTGKEYDVSPYRDDYESITNVPIVHAATAWQSHYTGQTYILVLNESPWMGDQIDHTLINPNQLRHAGTKVQDNPTSSMPISIITEDNEFSMELTINDTIVYFNTHTPSTAELQSCPHIHLSSSYPWDPKNVTFPKCTTLLQEVVGATQQLSAMSNQPTIELDYNDKHDCILNLQKNNRKIASIKKVTTGSTFN